MSAPTVSESDKSAARWMPFQCPACFALFRLQKGNTGVRGHCPQCREVLTVPEIRKKNEGAEEAEKKVSKAKTIAVAQASEQQDVSVRQEGGDQRRRRYIGDAVSGDLQWEDEKREDGKSVSWMVVSSCVLMFAVLAAVGVYMVKNAPRKSGPVEPVVIIDDASVEALQNSRFVPENMDHLNEEGEDMVEKTINDYSKFDMVAVEAVVRNFLESDSVDQQVAFVRKPEIVRPLMEKYYGGTTFEPEGYEDFLRSDIRYRGSFMTSYARTADFSFGPIAVERIGEGEDAEYRVDWESWVGYCDMPVEEMVRAKPTDPQLLRIKIRSGSYYNYAFSDDQTWQAYRLGFRNSNRTLLGYVRRGTEEATVLAEMFRKNKEATDPIPYTLKVRYPENARSGDQVEIVDLIAQGWIKEVLEIKEDE